MELHLAGKRAVVTGASRGIGQAIARGLAAEGVQVAAGALRFDEAPNGAQVYEVAVDLSTPEGPGSLVDEAVKKFGGLDILVNNVGATRPRTGGFLSVTDADWIATVTIDFLAAVRTTRAALPHLVDHSGGTVVSVCSVNAVLPDPLVIDYSAAKAALLNFSKSLSKEFGPRGVRVNTVSPGPVSTALWLGDQGVAQTVGRATGADPNAVAQQAAAQMVTGRFSRPEEVADLVLLLASDRAGNVTGSDFVIDGGLITTL
ncbi:MAG: SDR family oxidoreductase [Chloroflexi bacterium]|nr:SDR family oxidoreductase [Chloroflexota bacterium]